MNNKAISAAIFFTLFLLPATWVQGGTTQKPNIELVESTFNRVKEDVLDPLILALRKEKLSFQLYIFSANIQLQAQRILKESSDKQLLTDLEADFSEGQHQEAETKCQTLIKRHPTVAIFDVLLSLIHFSQGDISSASNSIDQALAKDPDLEVARIMRARFYLDQGNLAEARKYIHKEGEQFSDLPLQIYIGALVKWEERRLEEAISDLENLLEVHPRSTNFQPALAVMYREVGKLQESYDAMEAFIGSGPPSDQIDSANQYKISLLLALGRFKGAQAVHENAFKGNMESWPGLLASLDIAYATNNHKKAANIADLMAKNFPEYTDTLFYRFYAHVANKNYSTAGEVADLIEKQLPASGASAAIWGMLYKAQDNIAGALIQYKKAIELEPGSPEHYQSLIRILVDLGRFDEALEIAKLGLNQFPEDYFMNKQVGRAYRELGKHGLAIASYKRAISSFPGGSGAHIGLGNTYREIGDYNNAEIHLKQAIELHPAYEAYWLLAVVHLEKQDFEQAIRWAQRGVQRKPREVVAYGVLAKAYLGVGKTEKATETCRSGSEKIHKDSKGYFRIGECYLGIKNNTQAESAFKASIKLAPTYFSHVNLGYIYEDQGRPNEAIKQYKKAISINPSSGPMHYMLARALYSIGELEMALSVSAQALRIRPHDLNTNLLATDIEYKLHRYNDALGHIKKAISLATPTEEEYALLAHIYLGLGKHQKGIDSAKSGLLLDPNNTRLLYILGHHYLATRNYLQATNIFRKSIELGSDAEDINIDLAIALRGNRKVEEALKHLNKALKLNPNSFRTYKELGATYGAIGRLDQALQAFKTALGLDPKSASTHSDIGYTYYLKKEHDKAIASYEKSLQLDPKSGLVHYNLSLAYFSKSKFNLAHSEWKLATKLGYSGSPRYKQALFNATNLR